MNIQPIISKHVPEGFDRKVPLFLLILPLSLLLSLLAMANEVEAKDEIIPTYISSSSELYEPGFSHNPLQLQDLNWSTDWSEGAPGTGEGESLTFTFDPEDTITEISILPGFWKSMDLYYQNAAPSRIEISSGSFYQVIDLAEYLPDFGGAPYEGYHFELDTPLSGYNPLTLTILKVREGTLYEDCVITEVHFFGQASSSSEGYAGGYDEIESGARWEPMPEGDWGSSATSYRGFFEVFPNAISVSSVLIEEGYEHGPWMMMDYDWTTGWTEGAPGSGATELTNFFFSEDTYLTGMCILPGYWKSERLYFENAAPTRLHMRFGSFQQELDLTSFVWDNEDMPEVGFYIPFDSPLSSSEPLCLTIESVREGTRYEDCVITEVHFFGYDGGNQGDGMASAGSTEDMIGEDTIHNLRTFCQELYQYNLDFPRETQSAYLSKKGLSSEEKAFGLYWYFYHRLEGRCWENEDYDICFYPQTAKDCIKEIYGSFTQEDWETFQENYIYSRDGEICLVNGIGDFGDAGNIVFQYPEDVFMEGDILHLEGEAGNYVTEDSSYWIEMTHHYRFLFSYSDGPALSGWQFEELMVY